MLTRQLGDIPLTRASEAELVSLMMQPATSGLNIVSVNLDHIYKFGLRPLREAGGRLNVYIADGWPVAFVAGLQSRCWWPRCTGADLLPRLVSAMAEQAAPMLVLGSTRDVHANIKQGQGSVSNTIVFEAPSRAQLHDRRYGTGISRESNQRRDQVVFLCLGKPLQEDWYQRHGDELHAKYVLPVGAALDFWAGSSQRAPWALRSLGLEWLHRLAADPKRLYRRYLFQAPVAVLRLLRATIR